MSPCTGLPFVTESLVLIPLHVLHKLFIFLSCFFVIGFVKPLSKGFALFVPNNSYVTAFRFWTRRRILNAHVYSLILRGALMLCSFLQFQRSSHIPPPISSSLAS